MTLWTVPCQAPLSMGILQARMLEWVPMPPPGDLPNPGIKPRSPPLQAYSSPAEPQGKPSIKIILNFIESIQHTAWHTETFIVDTGGDITYCYYFCGLMFSPNPQFSSILSFQFSRYKTTSNQYYGEGNGNPLQFLVWKIAWTEEPGRLQFWGLQSQTWLSTAHR